MGSIRHESPEPTTSDLMAELDRLRAEVDALKRPGEPPSGSPTSHTRRQAFRLAGAASAAAVIGTALSARPAAAADPNDVVKGGPNPVTSSTALTGPVTNGPVLQLSNTGTDQGGLTAICETDRDAILAINLFDGSDGEGGVAVKASAVRAVDFSAAGSGRIQLNSHFFSTTKVYETGEIHQSGGTLYVMVSPTTRRAIAGPATAGAFHLIDPVRVYDSRRPAPSPGTLAGGSSRLLSVADGRDLSTGAVVDADVVPVGATGIAFNLTVTQTSSSGFLSMSAGSATTANASIINWSAPGATLANASVVGVDASRQVRVFGGAGSTHFLVDVVGYYL